MTGGRSAPPEAVIRCLEPLLLPQRVQRMQQVLATRSDHVAFVFERMVDPHNLSAVLRSLDAFSFQDAHMVRPSPDVSAGISRGVTQGAHHWLTLTVHDRLEECVADLRERGYRIYASRVADGSVELSALELSRRTALLFGNEHDGVSTEAAALADDTFHIRQLGFVESLNLSVSAALCAHHARRTLDALVADGADPARFTLSSARQQAIYADWLRRSVRRADTILREAGVEG